MIRDVLQRSALMAAAAAAFACCAAPPSHADSITMSPRLIQVGKWAEGIAFDGNSMWVAESGQQDIAQLNPNQGSITRRVKVGRLPVGMTTFTDGAVYALVQTDKLLWQQVPGQAKGKPFSGLTGCPQALAPGDQALWILSEPNCSSENSLLIRLDPRTGARANSGLVGDGAQAIIATPGKIWVALTRSPSLRMVDQQTLAIQQTDIQGAALWALAASSSKVFAGGELGSQGTVANQGIVVSIDPASGREVARQVVDQRIFQVAADNENVVALSNEGKVYVFASATLQLQRVITLNPTYAGGANGGGPRAALIVANTLYISSGQQFGENGALYVLNGWRPAAIAPVQPNPIPAPVPAPVPVPGPVPGPAPITVANCPYQVVNTGDATGIWMYQDPDTGATQVQAIPAASRGLVVDRCLVGWCHASFREKSGWIESTHLAPTCN